MNEYQQKALEKLKSAKTPAGNHQRAVFKPVVAALEDFCRQDEEFARAVIQGGTVEDCVNAVVQGVNASLSDLEAYRRAAGFFFPGSVVEMKLTIYMSRHEMEKEAPREGRVVLNLEDYF